MGLALHAAGVALWSWNVDNDKLTMDEPGYRLWTSHLGSSIDRAWSPEGAIVTVRMNQQRLAA